MLLKGTQNVYWQISDFFAIDYEVLRERNGLFGARKVNNSLYNNCLRKG